MKRFLFLVITAIQFNFVFSQFSPATIDNVYFATLPNPSNPNNAVRDIRSISEVTAFSSSYKLSKPTVYEHYVRPFITDDARVVGRKLAQLETWLRIDKEAGQQWLMVAYGPSKKIELSIGGVIGYEVEEGKMGPLSYALPLVQAKYLFREYAVGKGPGFGLVVGSFLPTGKGGFKPAGFGTFSYLTISQALGEGERVLLHVNTGFNYLHINGENKTIGTWGFGSQVRTLGGFHLVGEIFSGDPYVPGSGTAFQIGFRHFFSDLLQVDMTIGKGVAGDHPLPFWFSAGVRIVTKRFLKKA